VDVLPGFVLRSLVHRTYGLDPAIRRNKVAGSLEAASVAREVQDHAGPSTIGYVPVIQKMGFEGGKDGRAGRVLILEQHDVGGWDREVQEIRLECSRVVDGSPEGVQFLRIDILLNV